MTTNFRTKGDALALPVSQDKAFVEYWHDTQPGFGIRVMRGGKRSYICRYKNADKKDVKKVIGTFDNLDYKAAWDKVRELRAQAQHEKAGGLPSLKTAYDDYIAGKKDDLAPTTLKDYERRMGYFTKLLDTRMDELTPEDWELEWKRLDNNHGRATALGCLRVIGALYSRLVALGRLDKNPVHALARMGHMKATPARTRFIKKDELPAFWNALHTVIGGAQRDYMLWLLFTGWRESLVGALQWERVDFDRHTYFIDKADIGNKAKVDFDYPVPDYLWEHVIVPRQLLRKAGSKWIIPSPKKLGGAMHNANGSFRHISAVTGILVSDHDFRRTFASIAEAALGNTLYTARLLAHNNAGGGGRAARHTAGYVQTEAHDLRDAINRVANAILVFAGQAPCRPKQQSS